MVAQIADDLTAHLEALFNGDADAFHCAPGLIHDGDKTLQRTTVGEKIVDDQHVIIG